MCEIERKRPSSDISSSAFSALLSCVPAARKVPAAGLAVDRHVKQRTGGGGGGGWAFGCGKKPATLSRACAEKWDQGRTAVSRWMAACFASWTVTRRGGAKTRRRREFFSPTLPSIPEHAACRCDADYLGVDDWDFSSDEE